MARTGPIGYDTSPASGAGAMLERRFPSEPTAVGAARRSLDAIAARLRAPALEMAKLLVSELTSNAVRHGPRAVGAHLILRFGIRGETLRVEVVDEGGGFVPPPPTGLMDAGGWGLVLVERVADRWGVTREQPTTVWFEIDRATRDAPPSVADSFDAALLDALQAAVFATDLRGVIIRWNRRAEELFGSDASRAMGRSAIDVLSVPNDGAAETFRAKTRDGEAWEAEWLAPQRDGGPTWIRLSAAPLYDERGELIGMVGVCVDVSDRREAEAALADAERLRADAERRGAMQHAIAHVLSTSSTLEQAAPLLIGAIGEALGWEVGSMWTVDADADVIRFVGGWSATSQIGPRFLSKSAEVELRPGVGLPGRVWATGRPAWIPDIAVDPNFPRAAFAIEEGLHAAFGFPVTLAGGILGVVEFFSRTIREPDQPLLHTMATIGAQLGQYVERQRTGSELVESEARKTAMFESALEAIITMGEDGRIVEINAAAGEMFGRSREEAVGAALVELIIPPSLREQHLRGLERFRKTGRGRIFGRRLELVGMRADGTEFPVELTVTKVDLPGSGPALFTGYVRDITHRKRAEELQARMIESERAAREQIERAHERLSFVADASMILSASLDPRKTLSKIARLVVPRLADWCSIHLVDPDGTIQNVVVEHADPAKAAVAREYQERLPSTADDAAGVGLAIRTGEPQLYAEITDEMLERVDDPDRRGAVRELGIRSAMVVPLQARGRALGAITFASSSPDRTFGREDLELAQDLARRAALALDNARLYEERSHIARTLLRALLPRRLPETPGLEIASFYQPAGAMRTEVGGDFFDVFELGEGIWGIVVGDVCGKGVEAAAVTGMARHTIRASALREPSPRLALEDLNGVMLREDGERFCTVALGRIETNETSAHLTVACGGHPSPFLVRRRGKLETVGTPGSLLGVFANVAIEDRSVTLKPNDLAVFYTDGLIDSRHPTPLDEGALRGIVQACAGKSAQETVDTIARAVADPAGEAPDDICVVAVRVAG
jgi:PAS domain S-box-containing protein